MAKAAMKGDVAGGSTAVFRRLCMITVAVIGCCFTGFSVYITVKYTQTVLEKLQMLPLFLVGVSASILGLAFIQKVP